VHPCSPPPSSASQLDLEAGEKKATSDFKRAIVEFSGAARRSPEAGNASGDGPSNALRSGNTVFCSYHHCFAGAAQAVICPWAQDRGWDRGLEASQTSVWLGS
jgi:hypothetical protein